MPRSTPGFAPSRSQLGLALALILIFAAACDSEVPRTRSDAGAAACTRDTGPAGIAPARWSDADQARAAFARHGFGQLEFVARDGNRLVAHIYRPSRFDPTNGPLWFVMHGVKRNAEHYLDVAAPVAERHQALAIVIEFSREHYPASEDYTLGIATRGRADARAAREGRFRAPEAYLYNEIERVFEAVRLALDGRQRGYYLFGHSAGAQFTHRLLTFVPCARVLGAVAANAGWYTLPTADAEQPFGMPYSLRGGPPDAMDPKALLAAPLTLLLGTHDIEDADDDPNVRGTPAAMAQGAHRLARGRSYFETGQAIARSLEAPFSWRLRLASGAGHDVRQVVASAGYLLFAPTAEPTCVSSTADEAGKLVLHEVMADPPPGTAGDANRDGVRRTQDEQFIEIVNAGDAPLCLAGWTLEDASGRGGHLFPLGRALGPGKAVVVFGGGVPTGAFGDADVQRATAARGLNLDSASEVLTLRDANGETVERLSWGGCGGLACATDHWPNDLRLNGSLVRWPTVDGAWRMHRDVADVPFSPGSRSNGRPW